MTASARDHDNGEVSRNVHDSLFKAVFSDPALAAQELRAVLPPALEAIIDWPTITRMPSDFIDPALRQRIGDLAFHSELRGSGEALLWLLEHCSSEEWWMLQRILDTKSMMWWTWRRLNPDARHLPVIVPVVVYNGPRPWRAPTDMHALYALPDDLRAALGPHVLSYSFVLDDLCAVTDESLRSRRMDAYARICLFAMARAASRDFLDRIPAWRAEIRRAFNAGPAERIAPFMLYTYRVHRHTHPDIIHERIAAVAGPEHEEAMLSAYDQLIEKGIEKGQRATLLRLLGRRFGALPEPLAARVAAAPVEDLERWLDRIIDAASLDDVFSAE